MQNKENSYECQDSEQQLIKRTEADVHTPKKGVNGNRSGVFKSPVPSHKKVSNGSTTNNQYNNASMGN